MSVSSQDSLRGAMQSIIAAYDTRSLRRALAAYPARIKNQREACNQARKALKDAEMHRAEVEAELRLSVSNALTDAGKPRYSNVEAREAGLVLMKANDARHLNAVGATTVAEGNLNEAQDSLQMLLDEYQSARIAARLISAEMAMLSELVDAGDVDEVSAADAVTEELAALARDNGNGTRTQYKEAF